MVQYFGRNITSLPFRERDEKIDIHLMFVCRVQRWSQDVVSLAWNKDWKQLAWLCLEFKTSSKALVCLIHVRNKKLVVFFK